MYVCPCNAALDQLKFVIWQLNYLIECKTASTQQVDNVN